MPPTKFGHTPGPKPGVHWRVGVKANGTYLCVCGGGESVGVWIVVVSPGLVPVVCVSLPWSHRLSFILYWQILRRQTLLLFFCWHEALRAGKRKPLVETVGNLTFMPSSFDRRF